MELQPDDSPGVDVALAVARPGGRGRPLLAAGAALVVLVGGAVALGRGHDDDRQPPATSVPVTRPAGSDPTSAPAVTPTAGSPASAPFEPLPAFTTDPDYGVYVARYSEPGAVYRLNLTTGALEPVETPPNTVGVVGGVDGPTFISWDFGGFSAPVGDGTTWTFETGGSESLLRRTSMVDPTVIVDELPYSPSGGYGFGGLIGTSVDGRPVVNRADGRPYVVAADGALSRLAEGAVLTVQAGRFAETTCDPSGRCGVTLHLPPFDPMPVGDLGDLGRVVFSPDGTHVAVFGTVDASWKFFDVQSGAGTFDPAEQQGANGPYGASSAAVGWSPDSRFFAFTTVRGLWLFDAAAGEVEAVAAAIDSAYAVLGVA